MMTWRNCYKNTNNEIHQKIQMASAWSPGETHAVLAVAWIPIFLTWELTKKWFVIGFSNVWTRRPPVELTNDKINTSSSSSSSWNAVLWKRNNGRYVYYTFYNYIPIISSRRTLRVESWALSCMRERLGWWARSLAQHGTQTGIYPVELRDAMKRGGVTHARASEISEDQLSDFKKLIIREFFFYIFTKYYQL